MVWPDESNTRHSHVRRRFPITISSIKHRSAVGRFGSIGKRQVVAPPGWPSPRQTQCELALAAFMPLDKILKEERHVAHNGGAIPALRLPRHILRPFFGGVEGDDPDRILVLALKQVEYHGFQIGGLSVGFTPYPTIAAKVVHDEVNVLVVAIWYDRRHSAGPTHTKTPRYRTGTQAQVAEMAPAINAGLGPILPNYAAQRMSALPR